MKKFTLLLIGICLASCSDKKTTVKTENDFISKDTIKYVPPKVTDKAFEIIPGERIGLTKLEENTETLSELGKPDFSDAAMGKSWATWISKDAEKNELNIYSTYKDSEMKEKVVRRSELRHQNFKLQTKFLPENHFRKSKKLFLISNL